MSKEEAEEGTIEVLRESAKIIGHGYPIILDKFGNIVDGFHRNEADPNWPKKKNELIDTPFKAELARFHLNICRRPVTASEKGLQLERIQEAAKKQYGRYLTVEELSKITKFSQRWVYQYLPSRFKSDEMAALRKGISTKVDARFASKDNKELANKETITETEVNSPTKQISLDDYIDTGIVVSCPECHSPLVVLQNKNDKKDYLAQAFSGVAAKSKSS